MQENPGGELLPLSVFPSWEFFGVSCTPLESSRVKCLLCAPFAAGRAYKIKDPASFYRLPILAVRCGIDVILE